MTAPLQLAEHTPTPGAKAVLDWAEAHEEIIPLYETEAETIAAAVLKAHDANAHEALKAEVADLRAALKPFAALCNEIERLAKSEAIPPEGWAKVCTWENLLAARAALNKTGGASSSHPRSEQ